MFASSNHAVGTYNAVDDDPESMTLGYAAPVDADAPPRPDSCYGVSKVACEGLTKFCAHVEALEVVNLRIGWFMREADLEAAVGDDTDPGTVRFARALWLSPRDAHLGNRPGHSDRFSPPTGSSPLRLEAEASPTPTY